MQLRPRPFIIEKRVENGPGKIGGRPYKFVEISNFVILNPLGVICKQQYILFQKHFEEEKCVDTIDMVNEFIVPPAGLPNEWLGKKAQSETLPLNQEELALTSIRLFVYT